MKKVDFIHLKAHSSYSLLSSILKIENLIELCIENAMPAIALTDDNNLFGALEFATKAVKAGLQPIHGAILTVDFGLSSVSNILLLAKNEMGFKNLLYLLTSPHINSKERKCGKKFVPLDQLFQHKQGLIILSGYTHGPIGQSLIQDNYLIAKQNAKKLLDAFENNFYFEISRQGKKEEQKIENMYLKLANEVAAPLVATCEMFFANPNQYSYFETFLHISDTQKDASNFKDAHFRTQSEMKTLFQDMPFVLENSVNIAKRCSFFAKTAPPSFPKFTSNNVSEAEFLKKIAQSGLDDKLKIKFKKEKILNTSNQNTIKEKYFCRLQYEIDVICAMDFAGYFLIVHDFVAWSKANNIAVGPGRGSGAGSIVAWSLGVTDLDPVAFGLIFERFLNPERVSMPDFDIDFCQERRDEVVNYVRQKYGNNRVAHIITFGSLQAKAAVKDVARVLGLPFEVSNFLTNLIPFNPVSPVTLSQAINKVDQLNALLSKTSNLPDQILTHLDDAEEVQDLVSLTLKTALSIEGLPRHVSVHAAGIIIAKDDLINTVPLYKSDDEDVILTQYDMKYSELAGLVKFDFLGLQALTMISKCLSMLKADNIKIDFTENNFDNTNAYKILKEGKNQGIFQFESSGIKDCMQQLSPDCLDDLMALTSLYRPGPIENIQTYISCKFNRQQPSYLHPFLEPILKDTYGIIIYQEQVIKIATELAGYSLGQADLLRRAMGKKIASEMKKQESIFIEGAQKNNISYEKAHEIFQAIAKFAGYGFNKSHAAAYSIISYQTAYLKANYPIYFFISILNLELNDSHKIFLLLQEAKAFKINIKAPNINKSMAYFTKCKDNTIIFALSAVKNIGMYIAKEIENNRLQYGNFKSIFDFLKRLAGKITKKSLSSLVQAGAFDDIYSNRKEIFLNTAKLLAYADLVSREKSSVQISLFNDAECDTPTLEKQEDWPIDQKVENEFEATGIFWSEHPLKAYSNILVKQNVLNIEDIKNKVISNTQVKIAGFVHKKDVRSSSKGNFVTISLSDPSNNFEATIFKSEVWKEFNSIISSKSLVVLNCDATYSGYNFRFSINKVDKIDDFLKNAPITFTVYVHDTKNLEDIIKVIEKKNVSGFNFFVNFMLKIKKSFFAKVSINHKFQLTMQDIQKIENIVNPNNVRA